MLACRACFFNFINHFDLLSLVMNVNTFLKEIPITDDQMLCFSWHAFHKPYFFNASLFLGLIHQCVQSHWVWMSWIKKCTWLSHAIIKTFRSCYTGWPIGLLLISIVTTLQLLHTFGSCPSLPTMPVYDCMPETGDLTRLAHIWRVAGRGER